MQSRKKQPTSKTVTFFPEGGALLDGVMQNVAFKAQGSDGFAVEVEGNVFDGDENIATFTTSHDGMGAFSLLVDKDAKYEVEVTSKDGVTKRFAMPAVETKGAALSLAQRRDNIFYKINLGSETTSIDGLYLIIQARGKMLFATPLNEQILSGDLSSQSLPNGVVHFIVADAATKKPVTERLMFINNDPKTDVGFECSLNSFARRERVELTVDLKDMNGEPLSGDFSVSITDNSTVTPDSLAENILSSVFLSSELKGYIDNPGYYLQSGNAKVRRDADLLMMTHGWRKYMDFDFNKMPVEPDQYYVENGQYISGVVKNGIGSLVKNSDIVIFATKNRMFRIAETNDKGEFLVDGLEYPDSTEFVIQANRNKGLNLSDLVIYPEVYPFAKPLNRNLYSVHNNVEKDDYLFNSRERYYYEGGMKVFNLRDVEVEGKKNASSKESVYSRSADYSFTSDKIEERQFMRLFDMISELPGVYSETGQDLMIRGAMASPAIVINDIVYDYVDGIDLINYMDISDVARIDILRVPNSTALGIQGGNGAVVITTKSGKAYTPERSSNITTFMPMGYSRAAEFYIPVYDSPLKKADNKPDLRTTIHWVPSLKVDSTGVATIIYYCHDNPKRFRIEMEGISGNGEVVRFTKVY